MSPEGKVQVVVRSRKVPIGTVTHTEPVYTTSGLLMGFRPSRLVLFERRLDEDSKKAVEEAKKLARSLGVGLEVVEGSRWGVFGRMVSRTRLGGSPLPTVLVSPPVLLSSDSSTGLPPGC